MAPSLALIRSLVAPDEGFHEESLFRVPRIVILSLILFTALLAGTLTASFHTNSVAQQLLLQRELGRVEGLMANAPPEQREEVMNQVRRQVAQGSGAVSIVTGGFGSAIGLLIVFYELWLITILLIQFVGGEERLLGPERHGRSRYLIMTAMIPLALAELIRAVILTNTDPTIYQNAATYADYQEAVRVSLSIFTAAGVDVAALSPVPRFLLMRLGSPFVWWAGYIFAVGAVEVFRLNLRRALIVALLLLGLMALQAGALAAVGSIFAEFGGGPT